MQVRPRLYLAGPEVFRPDAAQEGARLEDLCRQAGAEGLFPLHGDVSDIRQACIDMVDQADGVVANISPFRGLHMDSGTAFEIGYAEAKGKPVFLWSSDRRTLTERVAGIEGRDEQGHLIEDFGKAENLMIVPDGRVVWSSPEEAIRDAVDALVFSVKNRALQRWTRGAVTLALVASLAVAILAGMLVNQLVGW